MAWIPNLHVRNTRMLDRSDRAPKKETNPILEARFANSDCGAEPYTSRMVGPASSTDDMLMAPAGVKVCNALMPLEMDNYECTYNAVVVDSTAEEVRMMEPNQPAADVTKTLPRPCSSAPSRPPPRTQRCGPAQSSHQPWPEPYSTIWSRRHLSCLQEVEVGTGFTGEGTNDSTE